MKKEKLKEWNSVKLKSNEIQKKITVKSELKAERKWKSTKKQQYKWKLAAYSGVYHHDKLYRYRYNIDVRIVVI